jgi:large subunit ribosomal protein L6
MSRVGKKVLTIPEGVRAERVNNIISVTGPNGAVLVQEIKAPIMVKIEGANIYVTRRNDEPESRALHGLYNRLIENMLKGVKEGFSKVLILNGVGYKVAQRGADLLLNLGMSHSIDVPAESGITYKILNAQDIQNLGLKEKVTAAIQVSGASKEKVGAVASKIRDFRPVEPYHLYGIRYSDEHVNRKESKSGAKKKK